MSRPLIGVSGPDRGGYPAWFFASWAIRFAGGRPLRLTPSRGLPDRPLDALVLGGGADVDPSLYGEDATVPALKPQIQGKSARSIVRVLLGYVVAPIVYLIRRLFSVRHSGLDPARDALENELLKRAIREGAPVLGICRGAQLINVHLGGTLHRDVTSFYVESANPWTMFPRKRVKIEADSHLAELLGRTHAFVNSLHRQAVGQLGSGLIATAREHNGVVQGIETPDPSFLVGVQWHPEYLPQRPEQRRLFREFVRAAREHALRLSGLSPAPVVVQTRD
ncbi:MAG TPA: gamma-glutamyl-gamma-aminobutyrate hydrolase family protein [Polyangiaceae bacterium]|nr:gamma-glutamyl-gamma-aminobutyrate hydrolase family protein [Polyangiaceae bacterium]